MLTKEKGRAPRNAGVNTGEMRGKLLSGTILVADFDKGFWVHFQCSRESGFGASSGARIVTLEAFKLSSVFVTSYHPNILSADSLSGLFENFFNVGIYRYAPVGPSPVFAVRYVCRLW